MRRLVQDECDTDPKRRPRSRQVHRNWITVFLFTKKPDLPILALGVFFSAAGGLLQPSLAVIFGKYFQSFSDYASGKIDGSELMDKSMSSVYALLAIGLCTFLLKGGLFASWLVFGERQAKLIREQLFQTLLAQDSAWYDKRTNGVETLLARLQTQIRDLQLGASQPLGLSVLNLVQASSALGLAFHTNAKLALVVLSIIPVIVLAVAFLSGRAQIHVEIHNEKLTQATKLAHNGIANIVTVKCFNTQELEWQRYCTAVREAAASCRKQAVFNAAQIGFVRFAGTAMFVQGFWFGGTQVHARKTTPGEVVTTFWACLIATKSFEDILPQIIVLQRAQASAKSLKAVINKVHSGHRDRLKGLGLSPRFCGEIEMRMVSFAYPSRPNQPVLRDCSLSFPLGKTVFIIGRSGSGKSTIGQLLLRYYDAQQGTISIDGVDFRDIETDWIRNNITLVQQQTSLFTETIFRNVALGHHDPSRVTDLQVRSCVKLASLERTVEALPDGLNTRVGRGGLALSGGQRQRIAIARARLRDTPILILDEATSALDSTSRKSVMSAIRRWRRNQTTIIITHDLTQIDDEDMVYVVENGRVILNGCRKDIGDLNNELGAGTEQSHPVLDVDRNRAKPVPPLTSHTNVPEEAAEGMSRSTRLRTKDSFDFEMATVAEYEPGPFARSPVSSGPLSQRLKKGLSATTGALMKDLKRQSLARAKAMYILGSDQPHGRSYHGQTSTLQAGKRRSTYVAGFLSAPRTPAFDRKPLPVPPVTLELSDRGAVFKDSTRVKGAVAAEQVHKPYSTPTILATVWPTVDAHDRLQLLGGFVATLLHAGAPATFSYALVQVFGTYSLPTGYRERALMYSMVVLGIAVADGIASFLMQYLLVRVSQRWVDNLRMATMKLILEQPKGWFDEEQNSPGLLVSCLDRNAEEMKDLLGRFAAQLVVVAVMMAAAVLWSFITCWKMTLVSLAITPLLYLVTRCFESISSSWEARTNDASERIGDIYVETFADIKTVRSLTLESYFHKKYYHATAEAFSIGRRRAVLNGLFFGLSESAIIFFTPLIFWYGAHLTKDREWPVQSIMIVFSLLLFCIANASAVVKYIPEISSTTDTANRLLHLMQTPVHSHEGVGGVQLDEKDPAVLFGPIHFINLAFSYPTRPGVAIFRQLNLAIPPGKCTAIVGTSGSGKSTIISLILGLYPPNADSMALSSPTDPSRGPPSLTLAGRDIRTLDLVSLRSLIAVVPQSPILLQATVRENISYGLLPNSPYLSASRIESAARAAGIHEFIQSLPQGYATRIGDGGLGLSGGQAQRIVIARALVRNPKILILDEATSALDGESAEIIRTSITKLVHQKGRRMTVIVVTHAEEIMAFADHVVVLEQGSVVEQGPFKELLSRRAALWHLLSSAARDGEGRPA